MAGMSLALPVLLTGCFTTLSLQEEPPLTVRTGEAPEVAFVMYSDDPAITQFASHKLETCLIQRNVFSFVPEAKVQAAVAASGAQPDAAFGMQPAMYASIAGKTDSEYVLHGVLRIVKALKFTGWRQDVYSMFYLHNAKGDYVDGWRSDTIGTFADPQSELDPYAMVTSVINHTCAKIAGANTFQ
ncbi:hypothetical protein DBV39_01345 [Orrella marina]|uniref:Uncharacterized protein n=2 Tax=Orrella marina TaxID=2163011 RepID=A0A2R4XFV4_9BURK|nr:hypothetical protein DBV39_01345 [Orrella marina]